MRGRSVRGVDDAALLRRNRRNLFLNVCDIPPLQWRKRADTKRRVAPVHLRRHVDTRTRPRVAKRPVPRPGEDA